ncbi:MAG: ATP-binding protein, partial [Actinomycetota bacterium]
DRVAELIRDYADVGIGLARPSGDQLSLCEEAVPGSRGRVGAYQHHMPATTFAGSMFVATSELGDRRGPYLGETTGRARVPVHFDPLEVAQRNLPTVTTISGRPGGGKTTLAQLMAAQAGFRGTSVLYVDPKRETDGLAGLLGAGDVEVIDLDEAAAGILDPWAVADDPDEGAMLGIDALKLLLPGLTSEEERIVARACEEQSQGQRPSLGGVVRQLRALDAADAQRLGDSLRYYERLRTARLLFSPGGSAPPATPARLTILQMGGITLPDASTPRQDNTWAERAAVAVMFLAAALARQLAQRSRTEAKLLVFDEAWALTNSRQGRALIERLARMGRSQNTAVMLVSQNARDFQDESIRNCASAMFAFHAQDRNEAVAVLDLLGIAPTEEHIRAVVGLRAPLRNASDGSSAPGAECIFRDPDGRVGTVFIDLVLPELRAAFDTTPGPAQESASRPVAEVV